MSTSSTQVGDYFWWPRTFALGGYWNNGAMAGLFALDPRMGATSRVQFPAIRPAGILPYTKPTYPAFIPRRWIYLSEHARKARTRKKWKHAIARKIELYKKRNKGAVA